MAKLIELAALWTLVHSPHPKKEWSLERKLAEIKQAGFGGITGGLGAREVQLANRLDLDQVGLVFIKKWAEIRPMLTAQRDLGLRFVTIQLGTGDTAVATALKLLLRIHAESKRLGLETGVETHRATCTETPAVTKQLIQAFHRETGEVLPMTLDYSHPAVVRQVFPPYAPALLSDQSALLQRAQLFHCRPFNGHHCQVPVTNGQGRLAPELPAYLEFVEAMFRIALRGRPAEEGVYVCPELGPVPGGYALGIFPNSWEEAKRLRPLLRKCFQRAARSIQKPA